MLMLVSESLLINKELICHRTSRTGSKMYGYQAHAFPRPGILGEMMTESYINGYRNFKPEAFPLPMNVVACSATRINCCKVCHIPCYLPCIKMH